VGWLGVPEGQPRLAVVRCATHSHPDATNEFTMAKRPSVSAGLLLFRRTGGELEVFLVHPGGPFWKNRDAGAWSIPKGLVNEAEEPLEAACREFHEETGFVPVGWALPTIAPDRFFPLGTVQQKAGKLIHAWAFEGDADASAIQSNTTRVEIRKGSGRWIEIPEVDRAAWLPPPIARQKINPAQAEFIDRLEAALADLKQSE
jgi:predicted NUDIX family NTP pyrophosphohydrolase